MSNNKKLFEEAIADAKALREAAVANAKASLEESFAPRISAMFEKRMRDEEKDEMEEIYDADRNLDLLSMNEENEVEEGMDYDSDDNTGLEEEIDLEELFNALEEEDMDDSTMYEMDSELSEEETEDNFDLDEILRELEEEGEGVNEEDMMNEMFDMENEAASGNEGIGEITVDELRDIIKAELAAAGLGEEGEEGAEGEEDMNMDFNFDAEGGEIEDEETEEEGEDEDKKSKSKPKKKKSDEEELEELYSLYESMKQRKGYKGEPKELDEFYFYNDKSPESQRAVNKPQDVLSKRTPGLAASDVKGYKDVVNKKGVSGRAYGNVGPKGPLPEEAKVKAKLKAMMEKKKMMKGDVDESKEEELKEAIRTIRTLRGQLNEVNLLNAKLIYVNRIFKANSLNEGQKVNVVNSFDKATTLNEAKNVYEILKTTIKKSSNKKALTENKTSFASKVIGGRPASQPIIKADDQISRMQKLAGIK
jgi:hypothetical protein